MGKRNHAEKDALVGESTRISQDKSYPVSPGFQGFLLRNMVLFLYLGSLFYFLLSRLPSSHSATEASAESQPQIYALWSYVTWHRNPSLSCTKSMITSQGFFSPVMIEKCSNLRKNLERFNLYVTADLVTVCIGSTVQTLAEKEKQSMENTWREATSCYSNTSVLLKQRNHFCAFMYLSTAGEEHRWRQLFSFIVLPDTRLSFSYSPIQNSPANTYKFLPCSQHSTKHKRIAISRIHINAKAVHKMVGHLFYFALNSCSQSCQERWVMAGWTVSFHHSPLLLPIKIYQSFHGNNNQICILFLDTWPKYFHKRNERKAKSHFVGWLF